MGEGTRLVDYGKDIADLRAVVVALQKQVTALSSHVEALQKWLEMNGTLYGGAVAYSTTYVGSGFPNNLEGCKIGKGDLI